LELMSFIQCKFEHAKGASILPPCVVFQSPIYHTLVW
jgi:hypothetical protein